MGTFYFILAWWVGGRGDKIHKIKAKKCLPATSKSAVQNNLLKKLQLIFQKTVNKYKLKV